MAEFSRDQLEEIVARVTANVLEEMKRHEAAQSKLAGIRIQLTHRARLGEEVSWAPWTVALPPSIRIDELDPAESSQ